MFVGYTMTTKQYRLYNPRTRASVKSRDVLFYEDTSFFQQTAESVFTPLTKEEERVHPVVIKAQPTGPVRRSRARIESEGGGEAESGSGSWSSSGTQRRQRTHQQNVKTSPGPPRGVMVPLVLLVHPDPPWSTSSVRFQKVWIRMDRSGPGAPRGPQPPLVDQERSGPPLSTLQHFPDAVRFISAGEAAKQALVQKGVTATGSPYVERDLTVKDDIDSSETLAHLLQTRLKVSALESKIGEFRLNQSRGGPSVERQLRSGLEN